MYRAYLTASNISLFLSGCSGDASKARSFIEKHGHRAKSQPPSIGRRSAEQEDKKQCNATMINLHDAAKRLPALQAGIEETREELRKLKTAMAAVSEPLARCYYSEQVSLILVENRAHQSILCLSILTAGCNSRAAERTTETTEFTVDKCKLSEAHGEEHHTG